jgi:hypothetical protein
MDPWNLEENAAVDAMQQIWNQIYGKAIPYHVTSHDAIYNIVRAFMFVFSFRNRFTYFILLRHYSVLVTPGVTPSDLLPSRAS